MNWNTLTNSILVKKLMRIFFGDFAEFRLNSGLFNFELNFIAQGLIFEVLFGIALNPWTNNSL